MQKKTTITIYSAVLLIFIVIIAYGINTSCPDVAIYTFCDVIKR